MFGSGVADVDKETAGPDSLRVLGRGLVGFRV